MPGKWEWICGGCVSDEAELYKEQTPSGDHSREIDWQRLLWEEFKIIRERKRAVMVAPLVMG